MSASQIARDLLAAHDLVEPCPECGTWPLPDGYALHALGCSRHDSSLCTSCNPRELWGRGDD